MLQLLIFVTALFFHTSLLFTAEAEAEIAPVVIQPVSALHLRRIARIAASLVPINEQQNERVRANFVSVFANNGVYTSNHVSILSPNGSSYDHTAQPGYIAYQVDHRVDYANILSQGPPVALNKEEHLNLRNLVTIDSKEYKILTLYKAQQWLDTFKVHVQKVLEMQTVSDTLFESKSSVFFERFGLFTLPEYRKALESLALHDKAMVSLANDIKTVPGFKAELQRISHQAFVLQRVRSILPASVFNMVKTPFDIANYIETQAQKVLNRQEANWANGIKKATQRNLTEQNLPVLQQECGRVVNDITHAIDTTQNEVLKQEYKEFLACIKNIEKELPAACKAEAEFKEYHLPADSKAYVEHRPEELTKSPYGFATALKETDPHHNKCLGTPAQIELYTHAMRLIEKVESFSTQGQNPLHKAIVDNLSDRIKAHAEFARGFNQFGNIKDALVELRAGVDLHIYARSILEGTHNYEKIFSSEALKQTENLIKEQLSTLKKASPVNPQTDVQKIQNNIVEAQKAHLQKYADALDSLQNVDHRISRLEYKLNASAKEVFEKKGLSTGPLTSCVGNVYEHARHGHLVGFINQTAQMHAQNPSEQSIANTLDALINAVSVASRTTDIGGLPLSLQFDTALQTAFDMTRTAVQVTDAFVQGVKEGVVQGTKNFAHDVELLGNGARYVANNYKEIAGHGVRALNSMVDTLAAFTLPDNEQHAHRRAEALETVDSALNSCAQGLEQLKEKLTSQEFHDDVYNYLVTTYDHLSEKTAAELAHDISYHATSFGTNMVLFDGALSMASNTARFAKVGIATVADKARQTAATTFERAAASLAKLETAITDAEVHALAVQHLHNESIKVTGKELKAHLVHLSEQQVQKHGPAKIAAKAQEITLAKSSGVLQALKDIPAACKKLDHSIGDLAKIEQAIMRFKDVPGAVGTDGPISRVLKLGSQNEVPGRLSRARGSAFELETALDVSKQGAKNIAFGTQHKINNGLNTVEIDIETATKFIECKNWYWPKHEPRAIEAIQDQLLNLQKAANQSGKVLELHSKHLIPQELKQWLQSQKIPFVERL